MTFESPTILAPTCNNFGPRMIKSHYSKISRPSSGDNHEPRPRQLLSLFFLAQLIPKVMRTPYREVAAGGWQLDPRFLDILKNRNLNDILFGWQPALEATGLRISTSLVGSLAEENKWKRLPPGLLWSFCLSTWPWNNNSTSRTDCIASAARAALCSWLCTKHVTWSWNIPQRKTKQTFAHTAVAGIFSRRRQGGADELHFKVPSFQRSGDTHVTPENRVNNCGQSATVSVLSLPIRPVVNSAQWAGR